MSGNAQTPSSTGPELSAKTFDGPIQMSFPAVLRNPLLADRYAHLRPAGVRSNAVSAAPSGKFTTKKGRRDDNEGKRWVRRKENAKFSGNPHIVLASKKDMLLPMPYTQRTFPEPLPAYLSRNTQVAPTQIPSMDPVSANAGRFSLSLKGMRRELRKMGGRAESIVRVVETELTAWLALQSFVPSAFDDELRFPGAPVSDRDDLREVGRNMMQLVWATDDALVRYVVHCCARYHDVVSFSKEVGARRLTYLLRPNSIRPDRTAIRALDTPPTTDFSDHASVASHESDFVSEPPSDIESDLGGEEGLSAIDEDSLSNAGAADISLDRDEWSIIGDTDAEGDESTSEHGSVALVQSVESLTLEDADVDASPIVRQHHSGLRNVWDHRQGRSSSSPSRSPSRRPARIDPPRIDSVGPRSFYDYLYN